MIDLVQGRLNLLLLAILSIELFFNTSLENDGFCDLFEHKLNRYTDTVYKGKENVYNEKLKQLFPNIRHGRRFKIPEQMPKIDFNLYLKDLGCQSSSKTYCSISENVSKYELQQFGNLFHKTASISKLTTNKINSENHLQKKSNSINNELRSIDKKEAVFSGFRTARQELVNQQNNKLTFSANSNIVDEETVGVSLKRKLGLRRTGRNKFISPLLSQSNR